MGKYSVITVTLVAFLKASIATEGMKNQTEMSFTDMDIDNQTTTTAMGTTLHPCDEYLPDEETTSSNDSTADEWFDLCPLICLENFEYFIANGTAFIETLEGYITIDPLHYRLVGETLRLCPPDWRPENSGETNSVEKYSDILSHVTVAGLVISMICFILHLVTFGLIKDLRNLPGCNLASLCVSLLMGYISFLLGHVEWILKSKPSCILLACLTHFFMLSSFLWMNVIAFDTMRAMVNATSKLQRPVTKFRRKRYIFYCLYSLGISLAFVAIAIILDNMEGIESEYQPHFLGTDYCGFHQRKPLLILFVAPVLFLIIMNAIFFGWSTYTIFSNRLKIENANKKMLKRNFAMYARLAIIMGLTWIAAFLATTIHEVIVWYIFVALNTSQGLFIFIAFTCTTKVKNFFREKFRCFSSTPSSHPTSNTENASFDSEHKNIPKRNG